ncbi:hypothetical protein [Polaribacter vadi]|nr:hypothetical protein [Polaribacter vadi]
MIIITIATFFGYLLPNNLHSKISDAKLGINSIWRKKINVNKVLLVCAIIVIITSYGIVYSFYNNNSDILFYLKNPGLAYSNIKLMVRNPDNFENNAVFSSSISILLTLLSGTKYIFFTFAVLYWKQLQKKIKILIILTAIIYFITSFLVGSMITIATILMSIIPIFLIFIKKKKAITPQPYKKMKKSSRFKVFAAMALGVFVIIFFLSNRISTDNNLLEGIKVLGFYVSHGYTGLDYCLGLPFEPTFGFTSFRGISEMLVKYLSAPDFFENSYLVRNELVNGYPAMSVWSTIFPWLASDFSFYGIPFIMVWASYQFSVIWNRTIRTGNPHGYVLLGQFFIFWLMIPANNQLFHTLSNAASFLLILALYLRSKKYYKKEI